jgi:hypothetical protein
MDEMNSVITDALLLFAYENEREDMLESAFGLNMLTAKEHVDNINGMPDFYLEMVNQELDGLRNIEDDIILASINAIRARKEAMAAKETAITDVIKKDRETKRREKPS